MNMLQVRLSDRMQETGLQAADIAQLVRLRPQVILLNHGYCAVSSLAHRMWCYCCAVPNTCDR